MSKVSRFLVVVWSLLGLAVILCILITQGGCAANPQLQPTDASVSLGGAFQSVWGHTESAEYDLQQAKKFVKSETGEHFMDAASMEHGAVFKNLTVGMKAHEDLNLKVGKLERKTIEQESELDQFFSRRQKKLLIWISIGAAGLTIAHFVLGGTLAGLFPWTGIIRKFFPKKT